MADINHIDFVRETDWGTLDTVQVAGRIIRVASIDHATYCGDIARQIAKSMRIPQRLLKIDNASYTEAIRDSSEYFDRLSAATRQAAISFVDFCDSLLNMQFIPRRPPLRDPGFSATWHPFTIAIFEDTEIIIERVIGDWI